MSTGYLNMAMGVREILTDSAVHEATFEALVRLNIHVIEGPDASTPRASSSLVTVEVQ